MLASIAGGATYGWSLKSSATIGGPDSPLPFSFFLCSRFAALTCWRSRFACSLWRFTTEIWGLPKDTSVDFTNSVNGSYGKEKQKGQDCSCPFFDSWLRSNQTGVTLDACRPFGP